MNAIEAQGLTKIFPGKEALLDVNLAVPEGAICGFLGPNGAGKTTTVRIFNGVLAPNRGRALLFGRDVGENPVETHRQCGVMTDTAASYEHLSAEQNLQFFGRLHSMRPDALASRTDELLTTLDLQDARHREVKTYSTGMKKRLCLARALLHRPRVLFLDEPTSGLDPEAARAVSLLIQRLAREQRTTVFLCTHQLRYAEEICTHYGLILDGKMLGFGTFEELASARGHQEQLELHATGIPADLGATPAGEDVWRLPIASREEIPPLLTRILSSGGKVYQARRIRWSLEDLYFAYQRGPDVH